MSGVDQVFLRNLKEKINIVDIAGGYFSLEKKGGSYWACCPFHHEKTPSFSINEAGQFYHCFGCGTSGDVIRFVSEMENIEFMESVRLLAEKANIPMPKLDGEDVGRIAEQKRKRDTLLKILNDCAHFYLDNLNSGKADAHIKYILSRKIPSNVVRAFGLGASLNYNDLPKFLLSKGYTKQDILDSGTVNEVEGRLTDAQGGRLIYPIINSYNEVIGFGGRLLEKANFAKYVNTRDTLIFNKRKNLYNINLLKKLKRNQTIKDVIMVEGYMDTISLYQAGFKNVVASMGTSLTQDQARLIKRYTDTVLISYDGDGAGQKANMRGLDVLKGEGLNVKVVPLPEGLDPDDVIKQLGTEAYQKCLDSAMPLIDYKLSVAKRGFDLKKTEDKRRYITEALAIIRSAESSAEKEDLVKALSGETGISFESLMRDLEQKPAAVQPKVEKKEKKKDAADFIKKASRFVIASFLFGADYVKDKDVSQIPFSDEIHSIIARYLSSKKLMEEPVRLSELFEFFDVDTPEYGELECILEYSEGFGFDDDEVAIKYFNDCIAQLELYEINTKIERETQRLALVSDLGERTKIASEITKLTKQKEKIKNGGRI